jgi:preprotein translocase subunit SecE
MTTHARKAKAGAVAASAKKSKFSFFGEVIGELKKVRWPTKQETIRLSILVLIICILAGAILGGLDYGFAQMVKHFFLGS